MHITEKIDAYFAHGTCLMSLFDPSTRTVRAYSSPIQVQILEASDSIDGGQVLAEFSCEAAALFDVD